MGAQSTNLHSADFYSEQKSLYNLLHMKIVNKNYTVHV